MKTNKNPERVPVHTHEGGPARREAPINELRRTVTACLLWEDTFYEDGVSVADRIKALVPKCKQQDVADLAIDLRTNHNLRHVPLLLVRELARLPKTHDTQISVVSDTLTAVIQRPDEITEFLSLYWKDGKCPLSHQVRKGLANAFIKFSEYSLAKYNRDAPVKLRDAMFLVHPKPTDDVMAGVFKRLANDELATPDTWEVALSAGGDKKETFTRLLIEGKMGALAILRNLRNMQQAGVSVSLIHSALMDVDKRRVLPFRYIAAARAAPQMEPILDTCMINSMLVMPKLAGRTLVMVDVSGSMSAKLSEKSDLSRQDAASGLAVLLRGLCADVHVVSFSTQVKEIPPRHGMALIDAIDKSQTHGGTYLGAALQACKLAAAGQHFDRTIVVTDEQSADAVGGPLGKGYIINVATYQHGVKHGAWTRINGFSESVVQYIMAVEAEHAEAE